MRRLIRAMQLRFVRLQLTQAIADLGRLDADYRAGRPMLLERIDHLQQRLRHLDSYRTVKP